MNLPTTKPNERDLAWYVRECEWLDDRNRVLAAEVDQWAARCAAAIWMLPETVTGGQLRAAQDKFHRERENLRRENAALRELTSTLGAPNHINVPVEQWRAMRADNERLEQENAALRKMLSDADELERYTGSNGKRQWGKCSAWLHPDDAVVIISAKALDAARKEAQP